MGLIGGPSLLLVYRKPQAQPTTTVVPTEVLSSHTGSTSVDESSEGAPVSSYPLDTVPSNNGLSTNTVEVLPRPRLNPKLPFSSQKESKMVVDIVGGCPPTICSLVEER